MTDHNAPQVEYPLERSTFLGFALAVVCLAGAGAASFWVVSAEVNGWRLWLALTAWVAASLIAARSWYAAPIGHVSWDGQFWHWQSRGYSTGESAVQLQVALDLQTAMWVRLENPDHAVLWLWAEKSAMPHRWMDLRRAVHAAAHEKGTPLPSSSAPSTALLL